MSAPATKYSLRHGCPPCRRRCQRPTCRQCKPTYRSQRPACLGICRRQRPALRFPYLPRVAKLWAGSGPACRHRGGGERTACSVGGGCFRSTAATCLAPDRSLTLGLSELWTSAQPSHGSAVDICWYLRPLAAALQGAGRSVDIVRLLRGLAASNAEETARARGGGSTDWIKVTQGSSRRRERSPWRALHRRRDHLANR